MKKAVALLCLLLLASLLSACGGGVADTGPDDVGSGPENIELTLWTFPVGNWGNPTAVSNILVGFHKEYPNIHVSVGYLDYDSGDAQISQAVEDHCAPDLVFEGPERLVPSWGEHGWMVDLSDLWDSPQAGKIYENVRDA